MYISKTSVSIVLLFVYTTKGVHSVRPCLAKDGKYFDVNRNRCKRCPVCPPGSERNISGKLTSPRGLFGDTSCYPCQPCQAGKFNDGSFTSCQDCNVNCTAQGKVEAEPCNIFTFAICGDCLPGYFRAEYGVCEICTAATSDKSVCPNKPHGNGNKTRTSDNTITTENTIATSYNAINSTADENNETRMKLALVTLPLMAFISIVAVIVTCGLKSYKGKLKNLIASNKCTNARCELDDVEKGFCTEMKTFTKSAKKCSLSQEDLETDGCSADETIPLKAERSEQDIKRQDAENTELLKPGIKDNKPDNEMTPEAENIKIVKGDRFTTNVSTSIHRDPEEFFQCLGITEEVSYGEKDTLTTTHKYTKNEYIQQVLHKWIERSSPDNTLTKLCWALRESGFGHIADSLKKIR